MMTPSQPGSNPATSTLILRSAEGNLTVSHDGFTIGSSRRCDLMIEEMGIPSLHSVIHIQGDAMWIEAADEQVMLEINGRACRRMSLRHDDTMKIGSISFTVMLKPEVEAPFQSMAIGEDLSLLTAEELCDRILSEQSMVDEFVTAQRAGWEALVRAIKEANETPETITPIETETHPVTDHTDEEKTLTQIIDQIEELNLAIAERTQQLSEREKEVIESTSILDETQREVSQRLEKLLDQLSQNDGDKDLRASA